MSNMIILFISLGILALLFSAGLGAFINGEKELSIIKGVVIGGIFPLVGIIFLLLQDSSREEEVIETISSVTLSNSKK